MENYGSLADWVAAVGTAVAAYYAFKAFQTSRQSLEESQRANAEALRLTKENLAETSRANRNAIRPMLVIEQHYDYEAADIKLKNVGNGPAEILSVTFMDRADRKFYTLGIMLPVEAPKDFPAEFKELATIPGVNPRIAAPGEISLLHINISSFAIGADYFEAKKMLRAFYQNLNGVVVTVHYRTLYGRAKPYQALLDTSTMLKTEITES